MITLTGTLLAAATAITLLLTSPTAPQPPTRPHADTPANSAASADKTEPALSGPITGTLAATLTDPQPDYYSPFRVAFAPDSKILAVSASTVAENSTPTYLWDVATEKITATLTDPDGQGTWAVAFAPDGTTLATGDANGSTYLWDIATHKITATLTDPSGGSLDWMAFAPGGTTQATRVCVVKGVSGTDR
jgi:WD40 repeat protein